MKLRLSLSIALGLAGLAALGSGCATAPPMHSDRKGFFERVASADHSRKSNRFARANRRVADDSDSGPGSGDALARKGAIEVQVGQLQWPLKSVAVTSAYGKRGANFHEGIDLRARLGTPVYAAQEGTVIYAGSKIRGYGKLVVVRHHKEISTIYAHNSRLLVRVGQYVRVGQKVALSGNTGHSHGPHLHFEVRDGLAALNPLDLMPESLLASGQAPAVGESKPAALARAEALPPTAPITVADNREVPAPERPIASRTVQSEKQVPGKVAASNRVGKLKATQAKKPAKYSTRSGRAKMVAASNDAIPNASTLTD